MLKKKFFIFLAFALFGIIFAIDIPTMILLFLCLLVISFIFDHFTETLKSGFKESEKIDGYYPEDKLKEYYTNASKKTAEYIAPDHKSDIDYKNTLHKSPNMAKNFLSELDKIFK